MNASDDRDLWKKGWLDEELAEIAERTRNLPEEFHRGVRALVEEARRAAEEEREIFGRYRPPRRDSQDTPSGD